MIRVWNILRPLQKFGKIKVYDIAFFITVDLSVNSVATSSFHITIFICHFLLTPKHLRILCFNCKKKNNFTTETQLRWKYNMVLPYCILHFVLASKSSWYYILVVIQYYFLVMSFPVDSETHISFYWRNMISRNLNRSSFHQLRIVTIIRRPWVS